MPLHSVPAVVREGAPASERSTSVREEHHGARRHANDHVQRWADGLRGRPTWLFSSGVTDGPMAPGIAAPGPVGDARRVAVDIGAVYLARFGGRVERRLLSPDERRARSAALLADGDHRDPAAVGEWADGIAAWPAARHRLAGVR